ncbi:EndoU domain-containing protein [Flavobacterium sp.]|uniref:EndoU domain-containing protein n=1 Tax=Flavobacterium sp. TaxID=239 RepID=UPI0035290577
MSFKYYIGKNGMYGKDKIQTDKFIFKTLEKNPYIGIGGDFEGPYSNLNELIEKSNFYSELKTKNSRTASKLILPKNIQTLERVILIPKGKTFDKELYNFIQHAIKPEFKKEEISGLHFFNPKNTKITKVHTVNNKGVLDVDILKLDTDTQKWLKKRTTIFPLNWHLGNLLAELEIAYLYRFPIQNKKSQFGGITANGIKVIFIFANGKPKTAYPII